MEKLSKEYMIQQVIAHKDSLKEATDQLSQVLSEARSKDAASWKIDEKTALQIRKIVHEIMEEISIIGGFCDSWTKNYLDKLSPVIAGITAFEITSFEFHILELFATRINSIIVDFTRTPFRLEELKPIFSLLKEGLTKR